MAKAPKILKRSTSKGAEDQDYDGLNLALSWVLHHSCASNVQLAIISNVCREWRRIASNAVVSKSLELQSSTSTEKNKECEESTLRSLLVTDMARGLIARQRGLAEDDNTCGSFCLAWFAPAGIQFTSVSLEDEDDDSSDDAHAVSITKSTKSSSKKVTCCYEWRGYTHASEVLIPIGYATSFLHGVFDAATKLGAGEGNSQTNKSHSSTSSPSTSSTQNSPSHKYNTTFSVRGATLARPEGFCLCLDDDYVEHSYSSDFKKPSHVSTDSFNVDEWLIDYLEDPTLVDARLSSAQRAKKQRDLGRVLLPRVIMSTRRKYPLLHRAKETDEDRKLTQPGSSSNGLARLDRINSRASPQKHLPFEKRQRAVQFLNPDRSQAVRMITPKFPQSVHGPITAFIVAISTEDGCFFSGRSCRYELGHMVSPFPICLFIDLRIKLTCDIK